MNKVIVTLRNPLEKSNTLDYTINVYKHEIAERWYTALQDTLRRNLYLEKNFCFLGFPDSHRNLDYICRELFWAKNEINQCFRGEYEIEENYFPNTLRPDGLNPNQDLLNKLHNHFEILQGTVDGLSDYYRRADYNTKFAIRQLNLLCHEAESLILSQRKKVTAPDWVRPSQITTFFNAARHEFPERLKTKFTETNYNRRFGEVYLHWTQIGKTLYEVFRDEQGVDVDTSVCDAITHLRYYSGEFDIEWAQDVVYGGPHPWHTQEIDTFKQWLIRNNFDLADTHYNYGYHPIGQVDLLGSFGTTDFKQVWPILSDHLDIYRIEAGNIDATYNYTWADKDYYQQQIDRLTPGYDYSSRLLEKQ